MEGSENPGDFYRTAYTTFKTHGETMTPEERIYQHLTFLYPEKGEQIAAELLERIETYSRKYPELKQATRSPLERLDETDAILITYADQVRQSGRLPLQSLAAFLKTHLSEFISGVHILPFFPYSSDDGFSVINYRLVDPALGGWEDIQRIGHRFRLMFDAVINHISRESEWFIRFQQGDPKFQDYFIAIDPDVDLSQVVRPRALPLITPVATKQGIRHVWTTFSEDQIDLNYSNPQVLLEIIDLLLFYVSQGAEIIRLDAIAYLWKEIGTSCIHLPQTHQVVKLFRAVLDLVAPGILLITETNVPHAENISYFGQSLPGQNHTDEAQVVYQFPLGPLILHTFHTGNSSRLTKWTLLMNILSPGTTFFNFIASHDGIGVRPAEGILTSEEIQALARQTLDHGGQVSYKTNPDGSRSVYELNVTLFDALNNPRQPKPELDIRRFMASQAIMLSLAGVPGIYFHSLFGSHNCQKCFEATGRARSINREKLDKKWLEGQLMDPGSSPQRIFSEYTHLLSIRCKHAEFHPSGEQSILNLGDRLFTLVRTSPDGTSKLLCMIDVSGHPLSTKVDLDKYGLPTFNKWKDLIQDQVITAEDGVLEVSLEAYQAVWLQPVAG
jgi:glycosidase